MKNTACICALALACGAAAALGVEVDGVAAKVGPETILRSDVYEEMRRMGERDDSRYAEVRNEMIDRKLILRAAAEAKMTLQEWVVENRVREIIGKAFDGDRSKLIEALTQQKTSYPEWYARMKEDMIVGAMRWNVVEKNVSVSPAAVRREYEAHPERYVSDRRVSVSVILLKPEEAGRRDEISAALKEKDFAELGGRKYENVRPEDQFKPEICREIESMPKGTISRWIELDGWSFLLRKDAETETRRLSLEEAYDDVESAVKAAETDRLYKAWLERLRAETYIRVF
ncbi:MAG: peptidyl-prolyl cis-trans isomerase [Kiritimatiellae bacterium]|nr:peptidyl-prolyl cis-trans isomerase [Kiritimatiellia bacterium]